MFLIDSFHQESLCFDEYSDFKLFYITFFLCNRGGGGGLMNFVPVHCSPPTWPFLCYIVVSGVGEFSLRFILFPIRLYRVRLTQCSCVDVSSLDLVIDGCTLYGSSSNRMSTRRLPVITLYL